MKAFIPELTKKDPIKVLTIVSIGDPNHVEKYVGALFGTAYATKMKVFKPKSIEMKLGKLMARWPNAHLRPKNEWIGVWGLPVPDFVKPIDLIQKDPNMTVAVEVWKYGKVAEVLHIGPYSEEGPTAAMLYKFIENNGYQIDGTSHEEEYITSPNVKVQKTIIRYKVKKRTTS